MPYIFGMAKATDIRIVSAQSKTQRIRYRTPIKFGGRVVTEATLFDVRVEVETRVGHRGVGLGSMPLGNVWAWPSNATPVATTLNAMLDFGRRIVAQANHLAEIGHPLELARAMAAEHQQTAIAVAADHQLLEPIPRLAQLVSASPLDAAVHDAFGHALGANSYQLLSAEFANADLASHLSAEFSGEFLDRYTARRPKPWTPLYHLVGALDPLTPQDVVEPVGDGLPETLTEWIDRDQLTRLKIKLAGDDLDWDVARVLSVDQITSEAQSARGCQSWRYSADFNERCANVDYVLEFLSRVRELSPAAFERIEYLEQPTHRDLRSHPENRMHRAAMMKPVVIDESLVDYESLLLSKEQGYTGVALKACKAHSEALLMGAAAQKFGLFLCVQDLTCPGSSFMHSASLAARIPTVTAIEGNARQYCPAGNAPWRQRFPSMFNVVDGQIATGLLDGNGLGYTDPAFWKDGVA